MNSRVSLLSKITRRFMASSSSASVKVPAAVYGLDGRYASALYSAASSKQQLDTVDSELKRIGQTIEKDASLQHFLKDPTVSRGEKTLGVEKMLGSKYSEITKNFFVLLAENRRLDQTGKILETFSEIMAAHRGEVTVTVTTAKQLDSKLMNQLTRVLNKSSVVSNPRALKISSRIDPSIMGGMIVEIGDRSIDLSLASRVAKLNKLITESV